MEDEYYRPVLLEKKDLEIEGTDYIPDLNTIKEGNTIRVELDNDVIIQRISHEIYSNFESGVRELLNNEYRACRQARKLYNAKPKVIVTVNKDERTFSIEGVDSLGISVRIFDKVFRKLGVSGNVDGGDEIGMFGMGFASYTTLSEVITVETYAREDNQQYGFLGDRGIDFKILPKPDRDTYGTKMSLTYNKNVIADNIIKKVIDCARFSGVETQIDIYADNEDYRYDDYDHTQTIICDVFNNAKQWTDSLYEKIREKHELSGHHIVWYKEFHIDNDDYEFFATVAINKDKRYGSERLVNNGYGDDRHAYYSFNLVNTPIEMKFDLNIPFTTVYLNIKNERKFMPTADRDRMKEESLTSLQESYDKEIKSFLKSCVISTVKEYQSSFDKPMFDYIHALKEGFSQEDYDSMDSIVSLFNYYFDTATSNRVKLKNLIKANNEIVVLKSLKTDYLQRIKSWYDDNLSDRSKSLVFIRVTPNSFGSSRYETVIELLKQCEAVMGEEFIKENKLKPDRRTISGGGLDKPIRIWKAHGGYYRHKPTFGLEEDYKRYTSSTISEVNKNADINATIKSTTPKEFSELENMLDNSYRCVVVRDTKGLSDKIPTLDQLKDRINHKKFQTSRGEKTMAEIMSLCEDEQIQYVYTIENNDLEKQKEICDILKSSYEKYTYPTTSRLWIFVDGGNEQMIFSNMWNGAGGIRYAYVDNQISTVLDSILGSNFLRNPFVNFPIAWKVLTVIPEDMKPIYISAIKCNQNSFEEYSNTMLEQFEK